MSGAVEEGKGAPVPAYELACGTQHCARGQGQGRNVLARTKREVCKSRSGRSGGKRSEHRSAKSKIGGATAGRQASSGAWTGRVHFWVARDGGKRGHIFCARQKQRALI